MKQIILTISLAAFVTAAFAAETAPAEKSACASTNKAASSCPMHAGKEKEQGGCCEKKKAQPQGECPFKKAEAEKKAAAAADKK